MTEKPSILDHPMITGSYFFPRDTAPERVFPIRSGDITLACVHHVIDHNASTVIHFHGNGETVADYVPHMARTFAEFGLNSLFVEYRGYGKSTGTPGLVVQLDDVDAVLAAIRVPPERLLVFGRSIGSLYAIEFAHRHPEISGLILESAIADVLERILLRVSPRDLDVPYDTLRDAVMEHFDHESKLEGFEKPLLILHARHDHLVDVSHAQRLYDWSSSYQKRLTLFDAGDHNTIQAANKAEYLRALRLFCALHG